MKRVLVGADGSEAAAAALGWAGRLAARIDAEVVVANVFEPAEAELSLQQFNDLVHQTERRLHDLWTEPLEAPGVSYRSLVLTGPHDALLEAADREQVNLLVVGQRGGGGFAGLHLGSVAHLLVHSSRRPLAIVPVPGAHAAPGTIVVGIDESEGSRAAVAWCAELARVTKEEVVAVHAFDPLAKWVPDHDGWRQTAQRLIDSEWVAPLRDAGVEVRTLIVQDIHPVVALAAAAESEHAGLIVVGANGMSDLGDLRLGRVPIQLVNQTSLPVVLVPSVEHSGQ